MNRKNMDSIFSNLPNDLIMKIVKMNTVQEIIDTNKNNFSMCMQELKDYTYMAEENGDRFGKKDNNISYRILYNKYYNERQIIDYNYKGNGVYNFRITNWMERENISYYFTNREDEDEDEDEDDY